MKALSKALDEYFELRRGLGFELGRTEGRLRDFVRFMGSRSASRITIKLAVEFATGPDARSVNTKAAYLSGVRGFAQYLVSIDPETEVPPVALLPQDHHRPRPYIYSDEEVRHVIKAAAAYPVEERYALKPWTLHCVIGLLAVTGMRLGEALTLKSEDIEKSRFVPLHRSTVVQLRAYAKRRDKYLAGRPTTHAPDCFFVTTNGTQCQTNTIGATFRNLSRRIGLRSPGARKGPRIHDLRHRFAVATLLRWYRGGKKVDPLLPVLSTYLGHVHVSGTYWYLTCTPELMEAAGSRLEARWKGAKDASR
jgi:integrase